MSALPPKADMCSAQAMSAKCQKRTHAAQQKGSLFLLELVSSASMGAAWQTEDWSWIIGAILLSLCDPAFTSYFCVFGRPSRMISLARLIARQRLYQNGPLVMSAIASDLYSIYELARSRLDDRPCRVRRRAAGHARAEVRTTDNNARRASDIASSP